MKVFSSMEHIMTLVVEESDDIPPQLLSPILHYVRKDDKVIHGFLLNIFISEPTALLLTSFNLAADSPSITEVGRTSSH